MQGIIRRLRSRRAGGAVLLVLLLATACSAGPSARPPVAFHDAEQQVSPAPPPPKPAPVPPLGAPARDTLPWEDCTEETITRLGDDRANQFRFSCAKLLTTLDSPEEPNRGVSRVAVLGVGNGDIPLVVVNDADLEPGTLHAARLALRLPPEVLETFRIIGVDRRGTGESDPADCIPPQQRHVISGFDPKATDRAALDRLLDAVRTSSQECLLELDDRLLAYDTWRAAGDLEKLRMELGVPRLHALARGEASRLLTTYSERYPHSVGRMVLDGGPDPLRDAMGRGEMQARAAEETFDAFAEHCTNSGRCPLGPNPRKTVTELVERARGTPLPASGGTLPSGQLVRAILLGLGERSQWDDLAGRIAAANAGDGTGLAALVKPLVDRSGSSTPRLDADLITGCNDTTLRVPPQRSTQTTADWVARFPLFGGLFGQRLVWCGQWPVPQRSLPVPTATGLPPIPVISAEHDPIMPALGTRHLADQLASGVLVRWQGAGHGGVGRSACVTSAATRYLIDGVVPAPQTACPA